MTTSAISTRTSRLIDALILFVVISGGIIVGLFVASKAGLASYGQGKSLTVERFPNNSLLKAESEFPPVAVVDAQGEQVDLESILRGKKTVIGFVSAGCDACRAFVDAFVRENNRLDGEYRLLLLSESPEYFRENYAFTVYEASADFLDEYRIHSFPTIVAVDRNAIIRWVSSGFIPQITADFVKENL